MEKFENENNDQLIKGRRSTIRCLMGPRMHFHSMQLLVSSLVEGESRWRSLVEGESRWRSLRIRIMTGS